MFCHMWSFEHNPENIVYNLTEINRRHLIGLPAQEMNK